MSETEDQELIATVREGGALRRGDAEERERRLSRALIGWRDVITQVEKGQSTKVTPILKRVGRQTCIHQIIGIT